MNRYGTYDFEAKKNKSRQVKGEPCAEERRVNK
jgi:hypothetical protein